MNNNDYRPRIADILLRDLLDAMGAVVIEGAKWCGKTTTAEQAANSVLYLSDTENLAQNMAMIDMHPRTVLSGEAPMLIDEWQEAPKLWDAIRFEIDHRKEDGQFILTGSAVPDKKKMDEIHHTGTGRFAWLKMRPMSLWESGESNGAVSFKELFYGNTNIAAPTPNLPLETIAFLMCRGGWPGTLRKKTEKAALLVAYEYYKATTHKDISRVDGISRNPERAKRLMKSYARHQGAQVSLSMISADISTNEAEKLSEVTISEYINALKKIYVIEDALAWNPNLRSKTTVRSSDTRYFVDPSIATSALDLGPGDLINDLETMGLLFETMAVRDLRCYADALDGSMYHYRDKTGLECDAVMHLRGGRYGLIEIKLGGDTGIETGAATLKKLAENIDTTKMKQPSFLMVLTAVGQYAYTRNDSVVVVPITCLKP
ncbi:ATP-binding protein [Palleniella muris]|uniref:ATP-binding protein n=1 Tax=Palleniella muris TaxID=3038145 RepID=A0AC61QTU5_9BACT|nr:ATP-binding protein [Palleniella muris]TGX83840.1 ATP-binding protein [Palleniella muris]